VDTGLSSPSRCVRKTWPGCGAIYENRSPPKEDRILTVRRSHTVLPARLAATSLGGLRFRARHRGALSAIGRPRFLCRAAWARIDHTRFAPMPACFAANAGLRILQTISFHPGTGCFGDFRRSLPIRSAFAAMAGSARAAADRCRRTAGLSGVKSLEFRPLHSMPLSFRLRRVIQ